MADRGTPSHIALGPGKLHIAPLGSTEPDDTTPTLDAVWTLLGYTDEGSTFSYEAENEDVTVAEELDPVDNTPTGRTITLSFALAEITATNLKRAMNGGTVTSGTSTVTFEPPELGAEVRTMLAWVSEDGEETWVFRSCKQTGNIEMTRAKGSDKATIPCEFRVFKPETGAPFMVLMDSDREGAPAA